MKRRDLMLEEEIKKRKERHKGKITLPLYITKYSAKTKGSQLEKI